MTVISGIPPKAPTGCASSCGRGSYEAFDRHLGVVRVRSVEDRPLATSDLGRIDRSLCHGPAMSDEGNTSTGRLICD
jgi:hypothetical protein